MSVVLHKMSLFHSVPRRAAGMTFVEVLVAMSLMTLLFIIGLAVSNSFTGVKKVRNFETAISLANQALEAVRAARFREIGSDKEPRKDTLISDFHSSNNPYDVPNGEGFVPVVRVGSLEFKRTLKITDCPSMIDGVSSGLKLVNVSVTWRAPEDGEQLIYEAATTVSDQW